MPDAELPGQAAAGRVASIVLVNTGHGKGKSSAAFGVMGRAWARGWTVGVVQFVKSGKWKTGERKLADHLGIEWHTLGDGFTWESTDLDETAAKGRHAWDVAAAKLASGDYDLVILDEITYAVSYGWVPVEDVVAGINARSPRTNVVMTGRDAAPERVAVGRVLHVHPEHRVPSHLHLPARRVLQDGAGHVPDPVAGRPAPELEYDAIEAGLVGGADAGEQGLGRRPGRDRHLGRGGAG